MKAILYETWLSLRRNPFANLVLLFQILLLFYTSFILFSYYIDLPMERGSEETGIYYLYASSTSKNEEERTSWQEAGLLVSVSASDIYKSAVSALQQTQGFTYFRCNQGAASLPDSLLREHFQNSPLDSFLAKPYYVRAVVMGAGFKNIEDFQHVVDMEPDPIPHFVYELDTTAIGLASLQMDAAAVQQFGLKTQAGRIFNTEDYSLHTPTQTIPVVLGSAYQPYFSLGDTFPLFYDNAMALYNVAVIGFLEENSSIKSYNTFTQQQENLSLNHLIILPTLEITYQPQNFSQQASISNNYLETFHSGSGLYIPPGTPRSEITALQGRVKDILLRHGLPSMVFASPSYGVLYFQNETEEWVALLLLLVVLMLLFSLVFIGMFFISKINNNMRLYAIQIMNGCPPSSILFSFLAEILVLLFIPTIIITLLFFPQIQANIGYLGALLAGTLSLAAIVSFIAFLKLRKIDIEEIIRGAE